MAYIVIFPLAHSNPTRSIATCPTHKGWKREPTASGTVLSSTLAVMAAAIIVPAAEWLNKLARGSPERFEILSGELHIFAGHVEMEVSDALMPTMCPSPSVGFQRKPMHEMKNENFLSLWPI